MKELNYGSKKKKATGKKTHTDIEITNMPVPLLDELDNIVSHQGISRGQFLKMKIREMVGTYPEQMRKARLNPGG